MTGYLQYKRYLGERAILLIWVYLTVLKATPKLRDCRIGYRRFWAPCSVNVSHLVLAYREDIILTPSDRGRDTSPFGAPV
jgi:hypothetical protein